MSAMRISKGPIRHKIRALIYLTIILGILLSACSTTSTTSTSSKKKEAVALPRSLTLVVGCSPGCETDIGARIIAPLLGKQLGIPVAVDDVPGEGGGVAASEVYADSPTSGDINVSFLPDIAVGEVFNGGHYVTTKFSNICEVYGDATSIMLAKTGSPVDSWSALKAYKGTVTVGVVGVKSSGGWLAAEYLSAFNHIKVEAVPYTGGPEIMDAVLGGQVDLGAVPPSVAESFISSGKAVGVVEFLGTRIPHLSSVPSITSVGGSSTEIVDDVYGLQGPPGMSQAVINRIARAMSVVTKSEKFIEESSAAHYVVTFAGPTQWSTYLRSDLATVKKVFSLLEK